MVLTGVRRVKPLGTLETCSQHSMTTAELRPVRLEVVSRPIIESIVLHRYTYEAQMHPASELRAVHIVTS